MPLHITCREAARLMLLSEERLPALGERLRLGLHQQICPPCKRFKLQVRRMRNDLTMWRRYRDGDDPNP